MENLETISFFDNPEESILNYNNLNISNNEPPVLSTSFSEKLDLIENEFHSNNLTNCISSIKQLDQYVLSFPSLETKKIICIFKLYGKEEALKEALRNYISAENNITSIINLANILYLNLKHYAVINLLESKNILLLNSFYANIMLARNYNIVKEKLKSIGAFKKAGNLITELNDKSFHHLLDLINIKVKTLEEEYIQKIYDNKEIKVSSFFPVTDDNRLKIENKITIPIFTLAKSGTHFYRNIFKNLNECDSIICHSYQDITQRFFSLKKVVTIRDPRGFFYSLYNHINRDVKNFLQHRYHDSPSMVLSKIDKWVSMNKEEQYMSLILNDDNSVFKWEHLHKTLCYTEVLRCSDNVFISKFEDICTLDENKEYQFKHLSKLFEFFEIKYNQQKIKEIYLNSWGNSKTFNTGDPYLWKKELSSNIQKLIEKKYGYFIHQWSYN